MPQRTRRELLVGIGAATATLATPGFLDGLPFVGSDTVSQLALNSLGDEELPTFGTNSDPLFPVRYADDDSHEAVTEYIESEFDDAEIYRDLPNTNTLVVRASAEDMGIRNTFGLFRRVSGGLQSHDAVELVDINTTMSRPAPIDPDDLAGSFSDVSYDIGRLGWAELTVRSLSASPVPDHSGLAFDEDAPEATLREARQLVRAGDDVLSTVDTSGTKVIVIDTGAEDEDQFVSRILGASTNYTEAGDPTVAEDGTNAVADGDGHGSWVLGCILGNHTDASYAGFATQADALVSKSLGDDGSGEIADILAGIELAIEEEADVCCMSLGSPQWSDALADGLADAYEAGVFCVAAVGNDRYGTVFTNAPASTESAMGINACNVPESGNRDDALPSYFGNIAPNPGTTDLSEGQSTGAGPQLLAPGMNVRIDPFGAKTGTSMGAPMVAGAAAVLRSAEDLTVEETWDRLTRCAYPLPTAGTTEAEYGLLDVEAALNDDPYADSQSDVRNEQAIARDSFNERLSDSMGRPLAGLF